MGKTIYIDENFNQFEWIVDIDGREFENIIYKTLRYLLRNDERNIRISQTKINKDEGKDIIIKSQVPFKLFGVDFKLNSKKEILIYIECKFSKKSTLSIEKFGKNLIQIDKQESDYFILLTNSQISAYAYNLMEEQAKIKDTRFVLIDKYLLANTLGANHPLCKLCRFPNFINDVTIAYQTKKIIIDSVSEYEVNLLLRNYSEIVQSIELSLKTDINWSLDENLQFLVEPNRSISKKITIKKQQNIIDDNTILITVKTEKDQKILSINDTALQYHFEMPFIGQLNNKILDAINEELYDKLDFSLIGIFGEAGVGKSRILKETIRRLEGTSKEITTVTCDPNNQSILIKELSDFLEKKIYSSKIISSNNLTGLLNSIEDEFQHHIIIIEDCHHCSKELLAELKKIATDNKSIINQSMITLIITGRTDYTHSNSSFLSLIEVIQNNNCNKIFELEPLQKNETKRLIKVLFQDIPSEIVEQIVTTSQCIPFYIVQTIEYLFDIKLVKLINRNTIGIPNIEEFATHIYLPDRIEELIDKRVEVLKNEFLGNKFIEFLCDMSLLGHKINDSIIISLLGDEDLDIFELLIERRFIKYIDSEHLAFYHENIYKYFVNLFHKKSNVYRLSQKIYRDKRFIFELLSKFEQGKIGYYAFDNDFALKCFSPIIELIRNIKNYSSNQLDAIFIPYMDILFNILQNKGKSKEELRKVRMSHIYLLLHNRPLITSINKCDDTINDPFFSDNRKFCIEIMQLKAHTLLNMGRVQQSKKIMHELVAEFLLREELNQMTSTKFDLYDRLSGLYSRYNHAALCRKYNMLAYQISKENNDADQLALCKITESRLYLYNDTLKALKLLTEALEITNITGALRIGCHIRVGLITCKLLIDNKKNSNLHDLISECLQELKVALNGNYSHTITRCYLILATIHSVLTDYTKSEYYIDLGIKSSIRYGTGVFVWQFYNLKAINGLFNKLDSDEINKFFLTAIDYLKRQDLLFLGDFDFTSPNQAVITNYIKFLLQFKSDQQVYSFIKQLRFYDFDITTLGKTGKKLLDSVKGNQIISIDKNLSYSLSDKNNQYYFSVI
jgi:hypothetical protein